MPDLGESYGTAVPVDAVKGFEWPHFYYGGGQINPQLTAASQWWYGELATLLVAVRFAGCEGLGFANLCAACRDVIQGEERTVLSRGVYNSNGSAPYGCVFTSVKQVFNIPCPGA